MDSSILTIGSFNILADGLSANEFLCEGGDARSTVWGQRKGRLVHVLSSMLRECDVVVTQENDHFFSLLEGIRKETGLSIGGITCIQSTGVSMARKMKVQRQFSLISNEPIHDFDRQYDHCNHQFHLNGFCSDMAGSYLDESPIYGELIASMRGRNPNDLYESDDGIGIYFRKDSINLLNASFLCESGSETSIFGDVAFVTPSSTIAMSKCIRAKFSFNSDASKVFTVYGAHLKSGESYRSEEERCRELKIILQDAKNYLCPIIAMDSNNSIYYEKSYCECSTVGSSLKKACSINGSDLTHDQHCVVVLSDVIRQFGYVDAVGPPFQSIGNECFKMRHGQGAQINKHFQFMFDAIDKILVPRSTAIDFVPFEQQKFGFRRYSPNFHGRLTELRTSEEHRKELEEMCRTSERICCTTCCIEAFGQDHMLSGLYPNTHAPSDHPPVYCRIII